LTSLLFFDSSKQDGLAGSRFGWALVKDANVASAMWDVSFSMVIAPSIDRPENIDKHASHTP
jgi:hypothetical protein